MTQKQVEKIKSLIKDRDLHDPTSSEAIKIQLKIDGLLGELESTPNYQLPTAQDMAELFA